VSLANQPSTALAQEQEVGVKWKVKRWCRFRPGRHLGVLVGGVVVENHADRFVGRHLVLDGIEKADEFLMPVALHTAPDDLAIKVPRCGLGSISHDESLSFQPRQRFCKARTTSSKIPGP
jgi:hypothetical protein